jgi:hypothetical protein
MRQVTVLHKHRWLIVLPLGLLVGCAGSPLGEVVQRSLEPDPQLEESPAFGIEAEEVAPPVASSPTETAESTPGTVALGDGSAIAALQPGDPDFIGPVLPAGESVPAPSSQNAPPAADLGEIPEELRPYVADLLALNLLPLGTETTRPPEAAGALFSQAATRREYARWLFLANNTFYRDAPAKRVRGGTAGDRPAFQDVPTTDPDFAAIQGLAKAGIIPSTLSGNSTAVTFRPDAPLTRETLVLWKVPLDTRTVLPVTTPETVTATWGFQDTEKIEPFALRAVGADFQLGDFSNIRRALGYTTLFQPQEAVSRAEAAATLWRFGTQTEGMSAQELRQGDRPERRATPEGASERQ